MPTNLRRITFGGSAWTRRGNPLVQPMTTDLDDAALFYFLGTFE